MNRGLIVLILINKSGIDIVSSEYKIKDSDRS